MFVSQVTNQQLVEQFEVSIIDSIYAEDSKGRRKFLTDLKAEYVKIANKKSKSQKEKEAKKMNRQGNIDDFFVELDRAFPDYNVLIRETMPGLDVSELGLKVYCLVSAWGTHRVNIISEVFNREELEEEFGYCKLLKKSEDHRDITISGVNFDEMIEIIQRTIDSHKAAQ